MIMRRPYSRTATRRDHLAEASRNAQVSAAEVKEQAQSLFENLMLRVGGLALARLATGLWCQDWRRGTRAALGAIRRYSCLCDRLPCPAMGASALASKGVDREPVLQSPEPVVDESHEAPGDCLGPAPAMILLSGPVLASLQRMSGRTPQPGHHRRSTAERSTHRDEAGRPARAGTGKTRPIRSDRETPMTDKNHCGAQVRQPSMKHGYLRAR